MLERFNIHKSMPYSLKHTSTHPAVTQWCDELWEELCIDKTKKVHLKKECLINTIVNLKLSWVTGNYLRYSRRKNHYAEIPFRYRKDFYTYDIIVKIMDGLASLGFIEQIPGFINLNDQSKLQTAIKPAGDFAVVQQNTISDVPPAELVVLKDRITHAKVNYTDTNATNKMRRELADYNALRQSIRYSVCASELVNNHKDYFNLFAVNTNTNETELRSPFVYRVFNGSFHKGGRFYNGVESNAPKEVRKLLLINGNPTVEKDYNCLHIRMLYNMEGFDLPGDAYEKVSGGDPVLRSLYKLVGLVSINSKSQNACLNALRNEIRGTALHSCFEKLDNKSLLQHYNKWVAAHPLISKYLNSDIGIKLQYKDSELATKMISHFTKKGIPVLVVHDSFIVEKKYESELEEVMIKAYKEKFKFDPVIK